MLRTLFRHLLTDGIIRNVLRTVFLIGFRAPCVCFQDVLGATRACLAQVPGVAGIRSTDQNHLRIRLRLFVGAVVYACIVAGPIQQSNARVSLLSAYLLLDWCYVAEPV